MQCTALNHPRHYRLAKTPNFTHIHRKMKSATSCVKFPISLACPCGCGVLLNLQLRSLISMKNLWPKAAFKPPANSAHASLFSQWEEAGSFLTLSQSLFQGTLSPSSTLAVTVRQPWMRSVSLGHTSQFWAECATTSSEVCLRHHQEWLDCGLNHSACDQTWLANTAEALGRYKGNPTQPSIARKKFLWQLDKGRRRGSSLRTGEQGGTPEVFCSFTLFQVTKLAQNFQDARKVHRKLVFCFKMNYKASCKIDQAASEACVLLQNSKY